MVAEEAKETKEEEEEMKKEDQEVIDKIVMIESQLEAEFTNQQVTEDNKSKFTRILVMN